MTRFECLLVLALGFCEGFILDHNENRMVDEQKERAATESTLVLTHILFRHGNRTTLLGDLYPKDPHLNYDYYPLKYGDLTIAGKQKEYALGEELRDRYNSFLGELYDSDLIDVRTTDVTRTKMSVLLVLASLYKPKCSEKFKLGFNWQPIPYNYPPRHQDAVLRGSHCPNFDAVYEESQNSPEVLEELSQYADNFTYISENTGLNVTRFQHVFHLYFGLATEQEYGLELPSWTNAVWPDLITELAARHYLMNTRTPALRKMASGYFLQKIIEDTEKLINGKNNKTRLYLYSAHENNIGHLLATLDLLEYLHIPVYGSYVLFEVHYINGTYGFQMYYQDYRGTAPKLLKLAGCEEFCPIDTFKMLITNHLPEDGLCGISS